MDGYVNGWMNELINDGWMRWMDRWGELMNENVFSCPPGRCWVSQVTGRKTTRRWWSTKKETVATDSQTCCQRRGRCQKVWVLVLCNRNVKCSVKKLTYSTPNYIRVTFRRKVKISIHFLIIELHLKINANCVLKDHP